MSLKILVVAILALAIAPGVLQAKPHDSKGKAKAPLSITPFQDDDDDARPMAVPSDLDVPLDPDDLVIAPADAKPPTVTPPRPSPDPGPPPASPAPGKGKGNAFGRRCRGFSRRKAPGQRQSPFKRCIEARKDAVMPKGKGAPAKEPEAPDSADEGPED